MGVETSFRFDVDHWRFFHSSRSIRSNFQLHRNDRRVFRKSKTKTKTFFLRTFLSVRFDSNDFIRRFCSFVSFSFVRKPWKCFLVFFSWNELWVDHVESGSRKHGYGLLLSTFFFYSITITGIALLYSNNVSDKLNLIFISISTFLCLILSIISILPSIREYNSSCGLLQSSFVSLYVIYFTWSTLSSHRKEKTLKIDYPMTIFGLILFFSTLLYSIITSSRNSRTRKFFFPPSSIDSTILDDAQLVNSVTDNKWLLGSEDHRQQRVYDDERGSVAYNYSLFHLMLCFAILYSMSILTK